VCEREREKEKEREHLLYPGNNSHVEHCAKVNEKSFSLRNNNTFSGPHSQNEYLWISPTIYSE
jgi:hypothetical protein